MDSAEAHVIVSVATTWVAPGLARGVDEPALAVPSRVGEWVKSMTDDEIDGLEGRTLTQFFLNDVVTVVEEAGDWVRVNPTDQPTVLERDVSGWVPRAQLAPGRPEGTATHIVDAMLADLYAAPDGDPLLEDVVFGTRFAARGPAVDGWLPVGVGRQSEPAWIRLNDIVEIPSGGTVAEVLELAHRFLGVPFVWAGLSPYGIDCSGLIWALWRRLGVVVPRDACDLEAMTKPVPFGEELPGDLYFFSSGNGPASHVGLVTMTRPQPEERAMLHACGPSERVISGPLAERRQRTIRAAHRFDL